MSFYFLRKETERNKKKIKIKTVKNCDLIWNQCDVVKSVLFIRRRDEIATTRAE